MDKLSIIVLTHNRARLLEDCLRSLLAQDFPVERLEILVVDDGSTDGTAELLARYAARVRNVRQPHRGIPAARNAGLRDATGDVIATVADDYILARDYAATVMRFFAETPQAAVVRFQIVAAQNDAGSRISHFYYATSAALRAPRETDGISTRHELDASGAAAFRREVFERVGPFDESLRRAEDTDLTTRLRALGIDVYYCPQHHIRHQYDPFLRDTFKKCFLTGFYRARFYEKLAARENVPFSLAARVRKKAGVIRRTFDRRGPGKMPLLYLPFIVFFEATNKAGFLLSLLVRRFQTAAISAGSSASQRT